MLFCYSSLSWPRQKLSKAQHTTIWCRQAISLMYKDTERMMGKRMEINITVGTDLKYSINWPWIMNFSRSQEPLRERNKIENEEMIRKSKEVFCLWVGGWIQTLENDLVTIPRHSTKREEGLRHTEPPLLLALPHSDDLPPPDLMLQFLLSLWLDEVCFFSFFLYHNINSVTVSMINVSLFKLYFPNTYDSTR